MHRLNLASARQRAHYDRVAQAYQTNAERAQVVEYQAVLDRLVLDALPTGPLGRVLEVCAGAGDGLALVRPRASPGIGLDLSTAMLAHAQRRLADARAHFVQGDATAIPLGDSSCDLVLVLGGIHHVPDRATLFGEIARVLAPGGVLVFREPLDDFFLWRWLRAIVYRLSPALDHETESPLRQAATRRDLSSAGLDVELWRPAGGVGFCLLMNTDVLVVNRALAYLPGIRALARTLARVDEWLVTRPGLSVTGTQVIARARRRVGGSPTHHHS